MMRKRRLTIGIDPDSDKSGLGAFSDGKLVECCALPFPELIDRIVSLDEVYDEVAVYVEAGWLNHGNWHVGRFAGSAKSAAIGRDSGMCHQTGKLIIQMLRHRVRPESQVFEVKPFTKYWAGPNGKITAEELSTFIGQPLPKRTNQEMRDATLIAFCKQ